jgi:beta-1,4-mannosyltransferase
LTAARPRVASWPHWYGPNPYLPLLYQALAGHGVDHVPHVPLEPSAFTGPSRVADVLHLHWVYPLLREGRWTWLRRSRQIRRGLARLQAIRDAGAPLIWTVHNTRPHDGFRRGERAAYASVHAMADLRVYHSKSALTEAASLHGEGGGDALVMPHGSLAGAFPAPAPRSDVLAREGVPPGRRVLLCFGLVRSYKGFDVAVRAMKSLAGDACHLVVAGRPIDGSARELVRLARGADNITLILEELPAQRLADLLGAADVALLPYRAITGSGVLMHVLGAGRGVVASDLPYFREILASEPDAGVLVSPGDPEALARGVRAFLSKPRESVELAALRLSRAFDWPTLVEPLARWIHQAASQRR